MGERGGWERERVRGCCQVPFTHLSRLSRLSTNIYMYTFSPIIAFSSLFILFGSFSVDIIRAFKACKRDHPTLQFLVACNALKLTLNRCLKEQKVGYPIGVE